MSDKKPYPQLTDDQIRQANSTVGHVQEFVRLCTWAVLAPKESTALGHLANAHKIQPHLTKEVYEASLALADAVLASFSHIQSDEKPKDDKKKRKATKHRRRS